MTKWNRWWKTPFCICKKMRSEVEGRLELYDDLENSSLTISLTFTQIFFLRISGSKIPISLSKISPLSKFLSPFRGCGTPTFIEAGEEQIWQISLNLAWSTKCFQFKSVERWKSSILRWMLESQRSMTSRSIATRMKEYSPTNDWLAISRPRYVDWSRGF